MLPKQTFHILNSGSAAADESESLQADVMRFMAILGLCLMVIFALVQSLPSVAVDRETQRDQASDRAALIIEMNKLRAQIGVLSSRSRASVSGNERLQQIITEQEQSIAQLATVVAVGESEQALLEQQLNSLTDELDSARAQLAIRELNAEISSPEQVETDTEIEGFRLLFASDDAFFQQVSSGGIEVFVQADSGGYLLNTDSTLVTGSRLPASFQQLDRRSLPASLASVLTRAGIESSASWGVVLSPDLLKGIERARTGASSGLLVIEDNGQVSLRP